MIMHKSLLITTNPLNFCPSLLMGKMNDENGGLMCGRTILGQLKVQGGM